MKEDRIQITGKHSVCGVIGDPIAHTLSPLIHNMLAKIAGKEAVYVPFHVTPSGLEEAIKGAYALGIKGLNVTMPHKQELFKYVIETDPSAEMVGAINTLVYHAGGYKGYNTDHTGLAESLKEHDIEWKDKNVAIIGSGGAAYAAYAAVAKSAKGIYIFNRTLANAQKLKAHMVRYFTTPTFVFEDEAACAAPLDLVIQTTSIGMGVYKGEMPSCARHVLREASFAVDLIYNPKETVFLKYAKEAGCKCVNGFGMLFYQAAEAFELMHHISCEPDQIINIKRELSKQMEV